MGSTPIELILSRDDLRSSWRLSAADPQKFKPMAKPISVLLTGIVLLGVVIRGRAIFNSPVPRPQSLLSARDCVRQFLHDRGSMTNDSFPTIEVTNTPRLRSLLDHHVTRIEFQRFDPQAVVLIRPGPDRQPGAAGVDDDRNGIIDDRSELGATHSDDVCSVERGNDHDKDALVLQYGAFVPASSDRGDDPSGQRRRAIVFGEFPDQDRWSFLVQID